jgi:hypothetical protein
VAQASLQQADLLNWERQEKEGVLVSIDLRGIDPCAVPEAYG